jgi:hypothetical protein
MFYKLQICRQFQVPQNETSHTSWPGSLDDEASEWWKCTLFEPTSQDLPVALGIRDKNYEQKWRRKAGFGFSDLSQNPLNTFTTQVQRKKTDEIKAAKAAREKASAEAFADLQSLQR